MDDLKSGWQEHLDLFHSLQAIFPAIDDAAQRVEQCLAAGHKILLMGNGGSAADAQHIAAEIVGRYQVERGGLPAIALTTDTSILTAVGNDYGYDEIFNRQVGALAQRGDVVLAYSTSGNSANVCKAVSSARERGCFVIALTGQGGGKLDALADLCIAVPSTVTARVQECHAFIGHFICQRVDDAVRAGRIAC